MENKAVLLIIDMWNNHWCKQAVDSANRIAPKINYFAGVFRKNNQLVIHAPSGHKMHDVYNNYPQWLSDEVSEKFSKGLNNNKEVEGMPIYSGIGSCPDTTIMKQNWTGIHPEIEISRDDKISNDAGQIFTYLRKKANIIYVCGLHLNMCILKSSYGIINLVYKGFNVEVIEDLVDIMYNPENYPEVTVLTAKKLVVEYIRKKYCGITNSKTLIKHYGNL